MLKSIITLAGLFALSAVSHSSVAPGVQYNVSPQVQELSRPEHDSARQFFRKIRDNVRLPESPTIVLLGWDTGKVSEYIANSVPTSKVVNFVINADYKDFAADQYPHHQVTNRYGDITQSQEDLHGKIDLVYSSWVVGFIPEDKQVDKLRNMLHMLKTGGTCAVLFPIKGSQFSKSIQTVAERPHWKKKFEQVSIATRASYQPREYAQLMKQAGFKGVHTDKHPYTLTFANQDEFEAFVTTGISRYVPHMTQEETKQFVKEIALHYINATLSKPEVGIPYHVDMLLATGTRSAG